MLGAKLLMSTSFHPQTGGQTEWMNRNIGQIFRATVAHNQKNWVDKVPLTEFAINSSISATTRYALFELNYGYMLSMIKDGKNAQPAYKGIKTFAENALLNLAAAHNTIIEAQVFQTHNANKCRSPEPEIEEGDLVYLSTKNLNLPKARAHKLCPKYIGPYKVQNTKKETSNYTLELPAALLKRRIHSTFHVNLLKPYQASNDAMFPDRSKLDVREYKGLGTKVIFK